MVIWIRLLVDPAVNTQVVLPVEHFLIVTLVSFLAIGVAFLVVRTAQLMEQYQVLLIGLGFLSMAGFFAVHALATPGVHTSATSSPSAAVPADPYGYAAPTTTTAPPTFDYNGTLVGASAFLSLSVPSLFFAAGSSKIAVEFLRRRIGAGGLTLAVVALPLAYAGVAAWRADLVANLPLSQPPLVYALMLGSGVLLLYAAWQQARAYARSHFPVNGALVLAFVVLVQAQVLVVVATFWTLAWWGYHVMMLTGVVIATGALFLELDRRRGLQRFLSRELVERVVAGDLLRLAGERRTVTLLFADLRGSTTLAEQLEPEAVIAILNVYVGTLAGCVFAHDGMLDKFLGDGLMAIFGVVPDTSCGAVPGALAALDMRVAIRALNAERAGRGEVALEFGVAVHTGEVVLGAVGLPQRSDFTAIGDTVNTAARLEGQCKELGLDIVLSGETASRLPEADFSVARLGDVSIRGRQQQIAVATLAEPERSG
ncbi:MAG: adenylate/guanylate cyclase domain-containing protein [Chloroflexi bacterium]|nr:adenylate/guanylate cyclase domain-containing protein [Chloroflexota bacterium]